MLDAQRAGTNGSALAAAQARFDSLNTDLVAPTQELLDACISNPAVHPRLMNTLSMLEHMGSHKIMATQHGPAIDQATLRHVTEECHHAFFMKRQAEKAAGQSIDYSQNHLMAPLAARMYFQRLEASMVRWFGAAATPGVVYLYMSLIIEFRAIWFYSLYQQALTRHAHALSLRRLLGEEQNHLTEMAERLAHANEFNNAAVDAYVGTEHRLYARLLESLQQSLL